jgi:hypothetical protein
VAVRRDRIEQMLPTMYQLAARPGSPLDALLEVMADLHEPDERLLDQIETVFDPYRAPAAFVPWLTRWVGLEWLVADEADDIDAGDPDEIVPREFGPGIGRLRDVVAIGHVLAQWRGTDYGLLLFLVTATGIRGFRVDEPQDRPFHLVVVAPAEAEPHASLLRRIVDRTKPAATTAEIVYQPGVADPDAAPDAAPAATDLRNDPRRGR